MAIQRPPRPAATSLDADLRTAILRFAIGLEIAPTAIVTAYLHEETYASPSHALKVIEQRYRLPAGSLVERLKADVCDRAAAAHERAGRLDVFYEPDPSELAALAAVPFLQSMPDEEFLTALEHTVATPAYRAVAPPPTILKRVAAVTSVRLPGPEGLLDFTGRLFAQHGLPYTASDVLGVTYVGDPVVREVAIEPALTALADARMQMSAKRELEAALKLRRRGDETSLKSAIVNAANAVESTMKVLLDAHGVPRPANQSAASLFNRLTDASAGQPRTHVPGYLQQLACAAGSIRNENGGHGRGPTIREVRGELADAAIGSAAAAIAQLAHYLP